MNDQDMLIGSSIVLSYCDQNEAFAACLPQKGEITVSRHETDNVHDWLLLSLDKSISYMGHEYKSLLIRSRWRGQSISFDEKTGVFILLVPQEATLSKRIADIKAFELVAWGFAIVEST